MPVALTLGGVTDNEAGALTFRVRRGEASGRSESEGLRWDGFEKLSQGQETAAIASATVKRRS